MKPERLNLREMWKLYNYIKKGLSNREEYLIDEILEIIDGISEDELLDSIWLMYPKIDFKKYTSIEMITLFIRGLKINNFFSFVDAIQGTKNGYSR